MLALILVIFQIQDRLWTLLLFKDTVYVHTIYQFQQKHPGICNSFCFSFYIRYSIRLINDIFDFDLNI